ncbi:MAG: hypothetical protein F6K19_16135, partial [Cyanothece sp. SIO1E1]|nr:hypothetical protein [Cyanothece sp. SIO1E1]
AQDWNRIVRWESAAWWRRRRGRQIVEPNATIHDGLRADQDHSPSGIAP